MDQTILNLLIVLVLGAFIGLQFRKNAEEGHYEDRSFAGMRTCMAITLLGYISVFMADFHESLLPLLTGFFLLLVLFSYTQSAFQERRIGGTGEISLVLLFIVGALVGYDEINLGIILTILISIIASGRTHIYGISDRFTRLEVIETVKFAMIIFLILPILPTEPIDPWGAIIPYNVWLMVILISGIGFVGYMASKFVGKDSGILLTGLVGGTVSSTAVTTTMAIEHKKHPKLINIYVIAILLASLTMYVRVMIEAFIINPNLIGKLMVPVGAMLFTMTTFTLYFWFKRPIQKKTPKLKQGVALETPFSLKPALKFSAFFVVILLLIRFAELYLGNQGIYLTAIISSVADIDAITISLSQLSATQEILDILAIRAITYGVIANTFSKIMYIHLVGQSEMTKKMLAVFTVTALVGVITSFTL